MLDERKQIERRFLDKLVQKTVDAIIKANQTGQPGDGKIWVQPTENSISVRTSESGDAVLDKF